MSSLSGHPGPAVALHFQLAKAWQLKGNLPASVAGYQHVLALDPEHVAARVELGGLMLRQGKVPEALAYYEAALAREPDAPTIRFRYAYVQGLAGAAVRDPAAAHTVPAVPLRDNPQGKIDLRHQVSFRGHRGGWGDALAALAPLHNARGILFDGFLERAFAWQHWTGEVRPRAFLQQLQQEGTLDALATSEERGLTPYTRPWAGFLHNPPVMPAWFHPQESPQTIFRKAIWQQSLATCVGLFALSEYHGRWLRQETGLPVSVLTHPAEIPEIQFDFGRFLANPQKKVVQVGWWLRRLTAIYDLPLPAGNRLGYEKIRLVPHFFGNADHYLRGLLANEVARRTGPIDPACAANTRELPHLPDAAYDRLLSENLVFVELYDASANNVVVECLARGTPLLINPLPAVIEYLGADYPLYFRSLAEAAEKALDPAVVLAAHEHLKHAETRRKLSGTHFRQSFQASEVYRLI